MARCTAGFGALVILAAAGCGEDPALSPVPRTPPPPAPAPWDPALGTATLVVRAVHEGKPVTMRRIKMEADVGCERQHPDPVYDESVIEGPRGELANVVSWISSGVEGFSHPPLEDPVVFEMAGCLFDPHVVTLRTGQPLWILNNDRHPHRTLVLDTVEESQARFSEVLLEGGEHRIERIARSGSRIEIRDPVHAWMTAWALAFDHPFHGVTGRDGTVALPKVPAGTWTVSVWHEYDRFAKPGPRTVTVKDGETLEVPFVFRDAGR